MGEHGRSEAEDVKARIETVAKKLSVTPESLEMFLSDMMREIKSARQEGIEQAAKVAEQSCRASEEGAREIAAEIRALNEGKG